jgi:hypothetical protein
VSGLPSEKKLGKKLFNDFGSEERKLMKEIFPKFNLESVIMH